jgi:hypothetical protein
MFFYSCIFFSILYFKEGLKRYIMRPIIIAKFIYLIEAWKDIVCTITVAAVSFPAPTPKKKSYCRVADEISPLALFGTKTLSQDTENIRFLWSDESCSAEEKIAAISGGPTGSRLGSVPGSPAAECRADNERLAAARVGLSPLLLASQSVHRTARDGS